MEYRRLVVRQLHELYRRIGHSCPTEAEAIAAWNKITDIDHLLSNGLTDTTAEDEACYDELISMAVPFTAHWEDFDNSVKSFQWDRAWEKYLKHYTDLIDHEGRESYLPWNLYKSLDLNWQNGYNYTQLIGDCCGHSHKNSAKASALTIAKRTGRTPREIALSVAYAIARGNGNVSHGSGCNLNTMSKWASTVGNFWTADFGRYDGGKYIRNYRRGASQDKNALKTQTIAVHLPKPDFEFCYAACAAGFGINIGISVYPTLSVSNSEGLAVLLAWKSRAHAVSLIAAWRSRAGRRYVFMENSHGAKYASDSLSPVKQWGCWLTENDIKRMATERFGRWYVNLIEMG